MADPYGRSDGAYRQVRGELEKLVVELLQQVRDAKGEVPTPAKPRRRLFGFGKS